ncbi:caskin-1-like isoform X2 [Oncorhynchus keta]|uniref:caskin-1-like isoform X2 n=1 Tax=Oncorhynchus keta TaxID=8018 RepID=UPI00227C29A1|nr:caskin-1-like isoform X2 [Oncorhynchus keta]
MLETSMGGVGPGGGGAKTLPRTMGGRGSYLNPTQVSPAALRRQAGSGGLGSDDDIMNRRRTISGPLTDQTDSAQIQSPRQHTELRPEPRPRSTVVTPTGEGLITDGTATINRRRKPHPPNYSDAEKFHLMETDTIRRRPRSREHSNDQSDNSTTSSSQPEISTTSVDQPARAIPGSGQTDSSRKNVDQPESSRKSVDQPESSIDQLHRSQLAPQQVNGGVDQSHRIILRMRPGSEAEGEVASRRESCDRPEVRKPLKPPVSPKPSMAAVRRQQQDPPTPTRRVPLPGPEADSPDPRWMPPPVSFKPCPPPTGPKPTKPSLSSPTPLPRPLPIPDTLTPSSLSPVPPYTSSSSPATSPSTPQTPSTPGSTPHPVKPPRSSISGLSVDLLLGREGEEREERGREEERLKEDRREVEKVEEEKRVERRREKEEVEEERRVERRREKEEERRVERRREKEEEQTKEEAPAQVGEEEEEEEVHHLRLEETSASLAAALEAVEQKINQDHTHNHSLLEEKTTVNILDDIGSMFDDLADQLDAMLD